MGSLLSPTEMFQPVSQRMAFMRSASVSACCITAALVALLCLPYFLSNDASIVQLQSASSSALTIFKGDKPKSELEKVLFQASMANKTVIITTLNQAWAANNTMIDIFIESFRAGESIEKLLNHLVIVAVDQKAYDRCKLLHPHCYRLITEGVNFEGESRFMSEDFIKMMWRRIQFMGEVLELGYSFLFSDADIIWFRDPFAVFKDNIDFQISTDRFKGDNPRGISPNTGFLYARSNQRTTAMYKYWYQARLTYLKQNDQMVLDKIMRESGFHNINVTIEFFTTDYFSGFCTRSRNMTKVVTMHSNCCVGLSNKLSDLRLSLEDWKLYRNSSTNGTDISKPVWRAPRSCHM